MSFHASLQQFYRCTLTRCGVWNGVIVVSFWRARAEIVRALSTLSIYSQFQILTYPCTCIYETTNFLLGVLRGPSTILYCCRLARRLSRCGIRRFAVVPCSRKSRPLNSSVVRCPHSDDRGPYRTGLSTCLATRWIWIHWIHFSFPGSKDQPMGKALSSCYLLPYKLSLAHGCSGIQHCQRRGVTRLLR